jgi:probable rRNA maturation factor
MNLYLDIQNASSAALIPEEPDFMQWVEMALEGRRDEAELCIRIVDKAESQTLNKTYRHKDKPTNVLSFPFEAPEGVELELLGDLIICAPILEEEAIRQHKSLHDHWAHIVIHGTLHLLGYDHLSDQQAEAMESLETTLLARLNIDDPYTE